MKTHILQLILALSFLLPSVSHAATGITSDSILLEVNAARETAGTPTLLVNPLLQKAAEEKAKTLFNKQSFSHDLENTPFYTFADDAGYHYKKLGENLAIDFTETDEVVQGWIDSPLHKKNLLFPEFNETGIAVETGRMQGKETTLVVMLYGTPSDSIVSQEAIHRYTETLQSVTGTQSYGIAAIVISTATIEIGTMISFILSRKKRN